jgi:hypothetical protein
MTMVPALNLVPVAIFIIILIELLIEEQLAVGRVRA